MYCPNCKAEFNGMFCPNCGYSTQTHEVAQGYTHANQYGATQNYVPQQQNGTYQYYQNTQNSNNDDIVFDNNEKIISVLGNNFLQTFISTGTLGKGFALLSDKRIYFKGKCLTRVGSRWITSKEERAVNIEDITGTGFTLISQIYLLPLAAFFILSGMSMMLDEDTIPLGVILFFLSILCICTYFITKKTIFEINYPGGGIAFNLKLIKKTEAKEFQKKVMLMKDVKRNENICATIK